MLGWVGRFIVSYQSIHPEVSSVNIKLLNRVHQLGRYMYVYTVNNAHDMESLFSIGVDGIFTDDPLLAIEVRGRIKQEK